MSANNFQLTLDTLAPTGSISPSSLTAVKDSITVTINKGDATYMQIWYDTSANTASAPANTPWIAAASSHNVGFSANGTYYVHVILMDDVRNQSQVYHSGQIISDTVVPVITTIYAEDVDSHSHTYTNESEFNFYVKASDAASGLQKVVISGNFTGSPKTVNAASFTSGEWQGHLTFTSSAAHASQTITVVAYDNSGNTSTQTCSIIYDPDPAQGSFVLKATASATDSLQQYINASNNSFVTVITATAGTSNDIAYYRLWGDIQDHTSATDVAWPANTASVTVSNLKFTTTDGTKTVRVQLIDKAGNVTTLTPQTRHYDATKPTGDLWVDTNPSSASSRIRSVWIAAGNGTKNSTTVYYSADDATSSGGSGIKTIVFKLNGTTISPSISNNSFSFSKELFPAATTGSSANTVSMIITDNAGNSVTKTVTINIEESFTINSLSLGGHALYQGYYNNTTKTAINVAVTNSTAPGSGRATLYVWTDNAESTTTVPSGTTSVTWSSSPQTVANTSINKNTTDDSAGNWLHVKAVSAVGNVAYKAVSFTVDVTKPTYTATVGNAHTSSRTNTISIASLYDNLSGVDKIKISARDGTTLESGAFDWTTASNTSYTVVIASNSAEGTHGIIVQVRDKANNIETKTVTWEYDHTVPTGTLTLKETDGTTNKVSPTAIQTFKAVIAYSVDSTDAYSAVQYKIYGDISTTSTGSAITEQNAAWTAFTAATITTGTYYCTQNPSDAPADGVTKHVYIKLKDDAGNISANPIEATFIYNPRTAELVISNVSHQRISCTHQLRVHIPSGESEASTITGDYADVVTFTTSCEQTIQAWKVCAYTTYPASDTHGDAVTAMAKRSGSYATQGYSQTGLSVKTWTVTIDGQDFRTAVGGSASVNKDGIHYIVVFGQNLAGQWSIAGTPVELNS